MKKLISTLVMVALAGFAGFKGAVWWFVDRDLRMAQSELEQQGVINRGSIHSSLAGQATLAEASYQDFRLTQSVQAASLTFDAGSPWALIQTLVDPQRMPGTWRLTADGVQLTLDPNMFRSWVSSATDSEPALFAPPCGPDRRQRLGSGDLLRLGISEIAGEAILSQKASGLHLEINTDGTGSLELDWPGARLEAFDPLAVLESSSEPLTLTLRDGGTMRTIAAYCSREMSMTGLEWSALAADVFHQQLAGLGYQASPQLLALYRRWLSEGGELTLELEPASATYGLPVHGLGNETASLLVRYNGAVVPDVYLVPVVNLVQPAPAEAMEPIVPERLPPGEPGWRPEAADGAGQWLGHTVRVTLSSGRIVEGRLTGADERQLEVARPVEGGEVVYPLAISAVTGFEVWQRGSGASAN